MKSMKKLLCVVLSLTMILGMFSVLAYAHFVPAPSDLNEDKINVKYEIEQVDGTDQYTAVDNNIYKLTVYADAKYGISFFQVPIHFDKTKFAIVMADDPDILGNAMYSYDGNHEEIGDDIVYLQEYSVAYDDTNMYNASGATVTALRSAQYVGLGNANATVMTAQTTLIDASHPDHATWLNTLDPETTGCAFMFYQNVGTAANKMAHFNSLDNSVVDGWAKMGSIYFIRLDGVSEEDAIGSVFGSYEGGYGCEGLWNTSGKASYVTASYVEGEPGINIVSNAVVEAAAAPTLTIEHMKQQIRFQENADGTYAGKFDVRFLAKITNFEEVFADFSMAEDGSQSTGHTITEAGFLYNKGAMDEATAKAQIESGSGSYSKAEVKHIAVNYTDDFGGDANYVLACVVTDITDPAATCSAMAYVVYNDGTYAYSPVQTATFETLYNTYYSEVFPA